MNSFQNCIWLMTLIGLTSFDAFARQTYKLDTTDGEGSTFVLRYVIVTSGPSEKTVVLLLEHDARRDMAYVYRSNDEGVALKLESEFVIPPDDDSDATVVQTNVLVTEALYSQVRSIIEKHIKTAETTDSHEIRFYNCVSEVLRACEMRLPYRSPYQVQWVGDIPDYNKDIMRND